jgi:rhomboid family GlyGly-CTERM serine protease
MNRHLILTRFRPVHRTITLASIAALTVAIFCIPGGSALLEWNRAAIASGEFWRILSGHLTHFTAQHLFWDLATFLALSAWALRGSWRRWAAAVLASAAAISGVVYLALPRMMVYRGLSGVDYGVLGVIVGSALASAIATRKWSHILLAASGLIAFGAKCTWELCSGVAPFAGDMGVGVSSVLAAHWVGFAVGVAAGAAPTGWVGGIPARKGREFGGRVPLV